MKTLIKNIVCILLLVMFLLKGMAGILPLFSSEMNEQLLVELANPYESEEKSGAPEAKHEGEPNEYFITHNFHSEIAVFVTSQRIYINDLSALQPGFNAVLTPPPDQAVL